MIMQDEWRKTKTEKSFTKHSYFWEIQISLPSVQCSKIYIFKMKEVYPPRMKHLGQAIFRIPLYLLSHLPMCSPAPAPPSHPVTCIRVFVYLCIYFSWIISQYWVILLKAEKEGRQREKNQSRATEMRGWYVMKNYYLHCICIVIVLYLCCICLVFVLYLCCITV